MSTSAEDLKHTIMVKITGEENNAAVDCQFECGQNRLECAVSEVASGGISGAVSVGTIAVRLGAAATNLANRRTLIIQNLGNKDVIVGLSAAVTISTGIAVFARTTLILDVTEAVTPYGISSAASQDVRIMELA